MTRTKRIQSFSDLPYDWDGNRGDHCTSDAIDTALRLADGHCDLIEWLQSMNIKDLVTALGKVDRD